jgi:hypothetical protein
MDLKTVPGSEQTELRTVRVVKSIRLVFSLAWLHLIVLAMTKYSENNHTPIPIIGLPAKLISLASAGDLKDIMVNSNDGIEYSYIQIKRIIVWLTYSINIYNKLELSPKGQHMLVEFKVVSGLRVLVDTASIREVWEGKVGVPTTLVYTDDSSLPVQGDYDDIKIMLMGVELFEQDGEIEDD